MANAIYPSAKQALLNGDIDLAAATIKLALVTSTYTYNAAHDFFNDITNEVTASGYTAGGELVDNQSVILDAGAAVFDCDPVTWTIVGGITYRAAILYVSTGTASTSALLAYYDFETNQVLAGNGTATVTMHETGAIRAS